MFLRFLLAFFLSFNVANASESEPLSQTQDAPPANATDCERLAGYPDQTGNGAGIKFEKIDPKIAVPACEAATREEPTASRLILNLGRAKLAAKDYQAAMVLYQRAADMGNTLAMGLIGNIYLDGSGVPKDEVKAAEWFRKAADRGNAQAMGALASTYIYGRGNPQDYQLALTWLRKGADLHDARSMADLGNMYLAGQGVQQDNTQALYWFQKGAELGNAKAMVNLGVMYNRGQGVPQDFEQASGWWHKAADLGEKDAMFRIGAEYSLGSGVPKDYATAMLWMRKSAELGDARAMNAVATMYLNALGVTQDYAQALFWFEKAAALGQDPVEMAKLLGLKSEYRGITKDSNRAVDSAIKSLKMHNTYMHLLLTNIGWKIWTDDFHKLFQQKLKDQGLYAGEIDGNWSLLLETAIEKLMGDYHPAVVPG